MMQWDHLSRVCMTYTHHLVFSGCISVRLFFGSVRAMMHAVFPPLFAKSTTLLLEDLHQRLAEAGCR